MSNDYAPCFHRIDIVLIPSYIKRPCLELFEQQMYSEPSRTSKIELFVQIVKGFQLLKLFS